MGKKIVFSPRPSILFEGHYTLSDVDDIKKQFPIWHFADVYDQQSAELFKITHPRLVGDTTYHSALQLYLAKRRSLPFGKQGNWIYFSWNGNLIHTVNEHEYFALRTNRNRNLITQNEQRPLYTSTIGIAGLSVGSNSAIALAYQGIAKHLKLAEFDTLETTNLNRLRASIVDVGEPKIAIAAREIYEIDPYSDLHLYPKGLHEANLSSFVEGTPKPRLIFELIDDFAMKIRIRLAARKARIPVVMTTNLGDSILIDIERYDQNPKQPLFHGLLGNLPETILKHPKKDVQTYAVTLVGKNNVPSRALQSIAQIGKTLIGRPQLSSTITVSAGFASYIARKIILNENLPSGRYRIAFSDIVQT